MNLVVKFQQYFFLLVAFLLGSLAPLYGNVFNFVLLAFMLVLLGVNRKRCSDLRYVQDWYIGINVAFFDLFLFTYIGCSFERRADRSSQFRDFLRFYC